MCGVPPLVLTSEYLFMCGVPTLLLTYEYLFISGVPTLVLTSEQIFMFGVQFLCAVSLHFLLGVAIHTATWPQLNSQSSSTCISECGTLS